MSKQEPDMQKKTRTVNPFHCGPTMHHYIGYSEKLTKRLRAALITNLCGTIHNSAQEPISEALQSHRPNLVLMVGGIADHKVLHKGILLLLEDLKGQYPYYCIMGGHGHQVRRIPDIKKIFIGYGVTILGGQTIRTTIKRQSPIVGGVDDPHAFTGPRHSIKPDSKWKERFQRCCSCTSSAAYSILLSHQPEPIKYCRGSGFGLIVAGRARGRQVRMPGCSGGLLTPHQGFFPRYAGGQYALGTASLIVSWGLCVNRFPRIYNLPELVPIDLGPISQNAPPPPYTLSSKSQMDLVLL